MDQSLIPGVSHVTGYTVLFKKMCSVEPLSLKNTVWDVLFPCKIIDWIAEIDRIALTLSRGVIQRDRPIIALAECKMEREVMVRVSKAG